MAVSQALSIYEVANSVNIESNNSQVRIVWTSTQEGQSYNANTRTAYYYVSINGGAETTYSVSYTLPKGTTKTIVDTTITVPHKDDGSGTVSVRIWMDTGISAGVVTQTKTITLTTIARASQPSCITWPEHTRDVGYFGDTIKIHMNSKSDKFTHVVYYSFGSRSWYRIAESVAYNTTWQIPLELINELASNAKSGIGTIHVETYTNNGTTHVGTKTCEFSVKVPYIDETKPTVSMTLSPVGALPSAFAGLYIQGLTKVKADLSAIGKYGADISSYLMKVDSASYGAKNEYTSNFLASSGEKIVYGYATDSRENPGETSQTINVIPYSNPKLEDSTAFRCDKDGIASESGTYLKITGKRSYSPCISDGVQHNFCRIEYRYSQNRTDFTKWVTILEGNDLSSDAVTAAPLPEVTLSNEISYLVHIRAIDDIGRFAESFVDIPTEKVYWHRDGARNALGLGKYNERDNAIDSDWDFYMNEHKVTGLPTPTDDTDAVPLGLLKDYIVEKDITIDGWVYEKWNSGIAKCYKLVGCSYSNAFTLKGSSNFPFYLYKIYAVTATCNYAAGGNISWTSSWNTKAEYTNNAVDVYIQAGDQNNGGFGQENSMNASVHIIGTWKQLN